ncbi:MAG: ABC transporter substrate-binding protein [Gemmatimonadota bacterium]
MGATRRGCVRKAAWWRNLDRQGLVWAGLVWAGPVLAGCGGDGAGGPGGGRELGRPLVLGYSSELQTLNPLVSTDQMANEIMDYLLFTPLVVYDSTGRIEPWLAESWELSANEVVFTLRPDLRWHDGAPVTAEDVAFTFRLAKNPAVASPLAAAYLANVRSVEVLGPRRVRFSFSSPHAQPLEDFFWPPVPEHLLKDVPPGELFRHPFSRNPVGSGPYRFVNWEVGRRITFERTREFPAGLGGPARIARVVYRIVPEPTTLLAEFLRGDVQVDGPLAATDARRVEEASGVRLLTFPWRQFTYIGWNGRREPFDDPGVRRALTLAIDRRGLVEALLRGYGFVAASVIPPWHPYSPHLDPLPYAPDSAAALLERLGWRDEDGDGVRERDGRRLRFVLLASQRNPLLADLAQVIQSQLAGVGVEAVPRLLEWQTVLSLHRAREFDAVLTNWVLDNFRIDPRPLFHSRQIDIEGSANRSSYSNPVADSLMDLGVVTLDPAAAAAIWERFARIIRRDQPLTLLFWNDELAGVSEDLEDVRMDARGELVTLPRWRWKRPSALGGETQ